MYIPIRDEERGFSIRFPWDTNTAKGFVISLVACLVLLLIAPFYYLETPDAPKSTHNSIPIELLNFGPGDGTGMSKGNLSPEGAAHQGPKPSNMLEDASVAAPTKISKDAVSGDPNLSSNLVPKTQLASNQNNDMSATGSGNKNTGLPDGSKYGNGLGSKGTGSGAGLGLGDIEWGGGGNRIVLQKRLPKFPAGVNTSAQIRIKFTVSQDGSVVQMFPLQKGDPTLERAAMDALRQWRFNPLKEKKDMIGIITFTFKLS